MKKIREALSAMRSCIKSGEPWTETMELVHGEALEEVEGIERAAAAWGSATEGTAPQEVHDLMWNIMRESR